MFITQEAMDLYYANLRIIGNIKFTPRQVDIMACRRRQVKYDRV